MYTHTLTRVYTHACIHTHTNASYVGLPAVGQIFQFSASGSVLEDRAGKHTIKLLSGELESGYSNSHGLFGIPVPYVEGTSDTIIDWGVRVPETFTICTLARYSGKNQGRIFSVADHEGALNWVHSHYAGKVGVAYYQKWITSNEVEDTHTPNTDWIAMCGQNTPSLDGGVQRILVNGENKLVDTGGSVLGSETIMTNFGGKETSDFQIAKMIIWVRALTQLEMTQTVEYLRKPAGYILGSTTWLY